MRVERLVVVDARVSCREDDVVDNGNVVVLDASASAYDAVFCRAKRRHADAGAITVTVCADRELFVVDDDAFHFVEVPVALHLGAFELVAVVHERDRVERILGRH